MQADRDEARAQLAAAQRQLKDESAALDEARARGDALHAQLLQKAAEAEAAIKANEEVMAGFQALSSKLKKP